MFLDEVLGDQLDPMRLVRRPLLFAAPRTTHSMPAPLILSSSLHHPSNLNSIPHSSGSNHHLRSDPSGVNVKMVKPTRTPTLRSPPTVTVQVREHVKKIAFLAGASYKGGGRSTPPAPLTNASFFSKKCIEFSETKEYASIFCEFFSRESVDFMTFFKIFS